MSALRDERTKRLGETRLYLIVTPQALGPGWREAVEAALAKGHAGMLQLRCPGVDDGTILRRAAWLRALCTARRTLLLINDRPDLARAAGADGVHVGQGDASPREARRVVGADALLGLSTHDEAEVRAASAGGVDYAGLGPCFATHTKAHPVQAPRGPDLVARCAALAGALPLFPIGGITPVNAGRLVAAGATRLAVGAGVLAQPEPAAAAARLHALLTSRGRTGS